MKSFLPYGFVLTKTKKVVTNNKKKKNKYILKTRTKSVRRTSSFPPNLPLILLTPSEKRGFTDDGRLRDDSSSAVQ